LINAKVIMFKQGL